MSCKKSNNTYQKKYKYELRMKSDKHKFEK